MPKPLTNSTFNSTTHWVTKEGEIIAIVEMEDRHLDNTINYLRRKANMSDEDLRKSYKAFDALLNERSRRTTIIVESQQQFLNVISSREW
jgi:hypothetical protein